jgi:hypothetical protein
MRSPAFLRRLFLLAIFCLAPAVACRADLIAGSAAVPAAGVSQFDIVGEGIISSNAPGTAIPRFPGSLSLAGGGAFGMTTGFLATTWDFTPKTPSAFIPDSPPAASSSFLSQTIPTVPPGPPPGIATMRTDFSATFTIDGTGLAAQPISMAYDLIMIVDGSVGFDAVIDYTSSTAGLVESLAIHFAKATSGGLLITVHDSGALPDLPAFSTLTLSGFFQLQAHDSPGGSSTEIDVHPTTVTPEPGACALGTLGVATMLVLWRRRPAARR